ncbi:hypothetical protein QE152_g33240 [Popillia japonica]|uniref:Uncharacterized protein n=1 Tax=Popillia japonica TaxID=7064 RepID=A0AAW1IXD1_POPJA
MLAVAAKITETETCEDMNELSKVAKTAKNQNTRERRKAVCRDEARFEHKQTVLHEEANNIEEEYSVLQKVHLNIQKNQQLAISGLEEQAKRMKMHSEYKFPPIEKGTTVTIPVPDVDRSKGDLRNLIGIVMEVTPDSFHKIGTKTGALSNLYSRSQIANLLKISDVPNTTISLRTANSLASVVGRQVEILREEVEEITSLSQQFVEGAVQELNTTDIEELLLSHNEELIGMLEKNGEDEVDNDDDILPPKRLKMDASDRVFSLSQEIEAILVENNPVMERSLGFKRQIEEAISPYRELYINSLKNKNKQTSIIS